MRRSLAARSRRTIITTSTTSATRHTCAANTAAHSLPLIRTHRSPVRRRSSGRRQPRARSAASTGRRGRRDGTAAAPIRRARRAGTRTRRRARASPRQGNGRPAGAEGPRPPGWSRTSCIAAPERGRDRVRLGRVGQVDHRVREVELRLGHAHELDRARRGIGDDEPVRVGHADVLRREDHEPPRDEARVLARGEHAREPVEAGVDVGAADALDERREHVVVLVVAVAQRAQRERGLGVGQRDRRRGPTPPRARPRPRAT